MFSQRHSLGVTISVLAIAIAMGVAPGLFVQQAGAAPAHGTKAQVSFGTLGACRPANRAWYLPSAYEIGGMSSPVVTTVVGRPLTEPIVTEPIESYFGPKPAPAIAITESLSNATLPSFRSTMNGAAIATHPHAIVQFVESIASFHRIRSRNVFINRMSRVDMSQQQLAGRKTIRVVYPPSSPAISLPNSIYIVTTTMPNAPVLVFYTLHFGLLVTTFAFYGGRDLSVVSTVKYVNRAEQQLIRVCG
jgi:hypothetical protein